jgi:iron(III) transport system substrate-binding protein
MFAASPSSPSEFTLVQPSFETNNTIYSEQSIEGGISMCLSQNKASSAVLLISIALSIVFAGLTVARAQTKPTWETGVAAAKAEGKVIVGGHPAQQYRQGLAGFGKAYPDIKLEFLPIDGRNFGTRILAERRAGQFLWDAYLGSAETMYFVLKPEGVLDPLIPALILPEVVDDKLWLGGFADGWLDREKRFVYAFLGTVHPQVYVNRDLIPEAELRRVEDLLDSKWRGKMTWHDPREAGGGSATAGYWLTLLGEDFLRNLLKQDMVTVTDRRQQVEWLVRGRYPIGIAVTREFLFGFQEKGVGLNVKPLAPDTPAGGSTRLTPGGGGNVVLINRAPHPNAAKLFVNWLLTREAQIEYVRATKETSRRTDAASGPSGTTKTNVKYINVNKEELAQKIKQAMGIAKESLK